MDQATQIQLALLKQLCEQGVLDEEQYQAQVATLKNSSATFDQRQQQVQQQVNVAGDAQSLAMYIGHLYQIYCAAPGRAALTETEFRQVLADYLDWVQREYGFTRLHGLQTLQQTGAVDKPLSHVYTSLGVQHRPAVEPGGFRSGRRHEDWASEEVAPPRPVDMADLLTLGERIAIIGRAGSGKTTYLAFVATALAAALRGQALDLRLKPSAPDTPLPVPLLAPLRFWQVYREQCADVNRYHEPDAGTLGAFLLWFLRLRYKNWAAAGDFFDRLLRGAGAGHGRGSGALLLLDGLDEVVRVEERRIVRDEVERLLRVQYPGNRCLVTAREAGYRDAPFGSDFVRCDVLPMDEQQIAALVRAWCSQIYAQPSDCEAACEELVSAIGHLNEERTARGQEALVTTPLLVTMVVSVKYSRRDLPRERAKLYDACVDVVLNSEYTGREDDAGARRGIVAAGGPPDKQREWLSRLAFEMHRGGQAGASLDEAGVRAILAPVFATRGEEARLEPFIAAATHRGGLFEERGGRYQFTHLTFQEYLAAQHLSRQWSPEVLAAIVSNEWWREALLLTVGSLGAPTPYERRADLVYALCELAGPFPAQLAAAELAAVGLGDLTDPEPALTDLARTRLVALLQDQALPQAEPAQRAAAGNALAVLGDDRDFEALVEVPAGQFRMGDDQDSRARPQHEVSLATFRIGQYPVTVGQFRAFVEASGYRPRDPDCLRGMTNHPIANVTWHEARAYCEWQTEVWHAAGRIGAGEVVRLPTEAEWEKAARGTDGRVYPWGDEFDAGKCNAYETGLRTTSPVGIFPDGASPYGCLDMAGNVWEWTRSLWGKNWDKPEFKYPYRVDDGRENLAAGDEVRRVLRGGSFVVNRYGARCAFRGLDLPYLLLGDYGFRVVVSHPPALHSD